MFGVLRAWIADKQKGAEYETPRLNTYSSRITG
jgi:hypothetical protein